MPALYPEFRQELVAYRKATPKDREAILKQWKDTVRGLPATPTEGDAGRVNFVLAKASQMMKYADALHRFENEGILDFLGEYADMGELFTSTVEAHAKYKRLATYFEIIKSHEKYTSGLIIKKAYWELDADGKTNICKLFQEAQQAERALKGKTTRFEFTISHDQPADDALFPIQIQGLGKLANSAVDRVYTANIYGQMPIAQNGGGKFQLAGGGMVEPDMETVYNEIIAKTLEEHLEEEHGNLWLKAKELYNELNIGSFTKELDKLLKEADDKKYADGVGQTLRLVLQNRSEDKTNAEVLSQLVELVDKYLEDEKDQSKKTVLHVLRASMQVNTFRLTQPYRDAIQFMKKDSEVVEMEQWLEERALGGTQTSHALFLFGQPLEDFLEDFFAEKFPGFGTEFGDDLRGAKKKKFDLFELIARAPDSRFSHIMLESEFINRAYVRGCLKFDDVFNQDNYNLARTVMTAESDFAKALNRLLRHMDHPSTKPELAKSVSLLIKDVVDATNGKESSSDLVEILSETANFLDKPEIAKENYRDFVSHLEGHSSPRLRTIAQTLLAISAIALAATVAVMMVPGLATCFGLSAATATNVLATTTVSSGLLSAIGFLANRPTGHAKVAEDLIAEATKVSPTA